jgi:hypothetical protein
MGHGAVSGSATSSLVVVARVVSSLTKITATVIVKKKKKKEITATVVVLSSECVVARPSMKLKNSLTDRPSTAEENAIGIDLAFVHRSMPWPNPCESAREIPEISEGFNRGAYLYLYQLFNLPSAAYLYLYQYKKVQRGADPRDLSRRTTHLWSKTNPYLTLKHTRTDNTERTLIALNQSIP